MATENALSSAFYRHPAFLPHRILRRVRIKRFYAANTLLAVFSAIALFLSSYFDDSLILGDAGYGFLEHPGIFGWFLIQLALPISIHRVLKKAFRSRQHYSQLLKPGKSLGIQKHLQAPLLQYVGLQTSGSRQLYSTLFTIGFATFAWNTYQNLWPGRLAPLDFWDSINFPWGYFATRIFKFYIDALLLPSIIHIFAGIVWFHASFLRGLVQSRAIGISPFSADRCGGMAFLADLVLSPTITALIVSGLAFFGVMYTHRAVDVSTATGILVELAVLVIFYVIPTALIRDAVRGLKDLEVSEITELQKAYYAEIREGRLHGEALREAHEYTQYLDEIIQKIDRVPKWPHLAKVFGTFGLAVTPALVISSLNLLTQGVRLVLSQT
jgi:hypothetical protein